MTQDAVEGPSRLKGASMLELFELEHQASIEFPGPGLQMHNWCCAYIASYPFAGDLNISTHIISLLFLAFDPHQAYIVAVVDTSTTLPLCRLPRCIVVGISGLRQAILWLSNSSCQLKKGNTFLPLLSHPSITLKVDDIS